MGGLSGHMMHPYDDLNLTRDQLKDMILKICNGSISISEKIDGFNIHVFKINGRIRFARNKQDLLNGGMSIEDMSIKWKDSPHVRDTYTMAANKLINAFSNMPDTVITVSDNVNDNIIYTFNCECVNCGRTNLIPYSQSMIYIHNIWEWNLEDGSHIVKNINDKLKIIINGNNEIKCADFILIDSLRDMGMVQYYIDSIDKIFNECSAETIEQIYQYKFIEYFNNPELRWIFDSVDGTKAIFNRIFKNDKTINLKQIKSIYNYIPKEKVDLICVHLKKDIIKYCQHHIKILVLNIGNYIMNNIHGYINESNKYSVCQNIFEYIKCTQSEYEYNSWNNFLGGQINALEGIVYNYNNNLYKLTGSFAFINKMIAFE